VCVYVRLCVCIEARGVTGGKNEKEKAETKRRHSELPNPNEWCERLVIVNHIFVQTCILDCTLGDTEPEREKERTGGRGKESPYVLQLPPQFSVICSVCARMKARNCNTRHHPATPCNALQRPVALEPDTGTLIFLDCDTLQHAATRRNTLLR